MDYIEYEHRIYSSNVNSHLHLYGQLIIPLYGHLNIETQNMNEVVDNDSVFFLPPQCEHAFYSNNNNEFLVLDIPKMLLKEHDMQAIVGGNKIILDERWRAIKKLLISECKISSSQSSMTDLFSYFYRYLIKKKSYKSVDYIHEHFYEDIDLKTLAKIEYYNPSYYSEWFYKTMNASLTDYIRDLRIKRAKDLLINTDYSIFQISQLVGYKYNSSFTRAFRECEKCSPAVYRKTFRTNAK